MKFVRFFSNLSLVQLGITNLLLCFLLIYSACSKDTMGHPESATDQTLMQAVERSFESGQLGDLALGATPVFSKSMERSEGGTTFLLTPIEGLQAGNMGANLAFYKDLKGNIQHLLVLWRTADASYMSEWAPFKGDVAFSGDVAWVNAHNTMLSTIKFNKGQVQHIMPIGKVAEQVMISVTGVQDRNFPHLPNITNWESISKYWAALDAFYHNYFDLGPSSGSGGGGYISNSGDPYSQYVNGFNVTCSNIKLWIANGNTVETYQYGQGEQLVDYRLCELIGDLYPHLSQQIGFCLWRKYSGTATLEGIFELWNQSDKSLEFAQIFAAFLTENLDCQ